MSIAFIGAGIAFVGVGLEVDSMSQQSKAAKAAAGVDTAVGQYNAQVDQAQAQQIDEDTVANIDTERQNNAVYLSRQAASYASAGVLSTTGSPLHAQVITAGRMEQQIQQQFVDANQREQNLFAQASEGVAYGAAQATADQAQGTVAELNGGAQIAGQAFNLYRSGAFSGLGSGSDYAATAASNEVTE